MTHSPYAYALLVVDLELGMLFVIFTEPFLVNRVVKGCAFSTQRGLADTIFFFFQAEDGIRDHCVTGVQTCALPISNLRPEKSQTFELGLRGRLDRLRLDAAVFTGRYKDFIVDQQLVAGQPGNAANPADRKSVV